MNLRDNHGASRLLLARRRHSGRRTAGFTLIECLIYMAVLFTVTALAFNSFFLLLGHHRNITRCTDDILRAVRAGERWRADLRTATGAPILETNATEQVLRLPQAEGELAYVFAEGTVWRIQNGNPPRGPFLDLVKTSKMWLEPRAYVRVWHWDLELVPGRKQVRTRPVFSFLAPDPSPLSRNAPAPGNPNETEEQPSLANPPPGARP